ncbi:DUF4369 domain-containing protein [Flavobacterium ardleyense]|uniref:DUF4369 domain-containing protein n=1 Tax=Flavobacterium ardleyense TaxID=2038737 RepID=A0ABW5ZBM0_9FLAO
MKKIGLALLAVVVLASCEKKETVADANVHITGDVKGLSQGKLYLQKIEDTVAVLIDSIIISGDSRFESHIKLDSPEILYLSLDRGQTNSIDNSLPFFAEPGNIKIETTLKHFFADAKITGSKNHDLWMEYKEIGNRFNDENLILMEKRLKNELKPNQTVTDSIETAYQKLLKRKYRYTAHFAATHGDAVVAPYLALSEIADINMSYLDTIQKSLKPDVAKSKYGKIFTKYVKDRKAAEKK